MEDQMHYFKAAAMVAQKATCTRGRGGALVVLDTKIIGTGYNSPPADLESARLCHTDYRQSRKPKSDRTCCIHAEWRALLMAVRVYQDISGSDLYYVGIDNHGTIRTSGEPYCTVCSRLALELGVKHFVLLHEEGPVTYTTLEYNQRSFDFHGSTTFTN